jgi:hypothetical protein
VILPLLVFHGLAFNKDSLVGPKLVDFLSSSNDLEQYPSETPCSFNQVYSMIPLTELLKYFYQMSTGENRVGSKRREGEIEREKQINGVRDGALKRFGNEVGWK